MKFDLRKILFGNSEPKVPVLLEVTPPRTGERTLLGVENMLGSIAVPEPFSLELSGNMHGVALMARCLDHRVVRQQISTHYPQARIVEVAPGDDPLRLQEGEQAWGMSLRASGPEYTSLRTFRDQDLLLPGSDPLISLLGALSGLNEGERIVARLKLRSLGPDWSQGYIHMAHGRQEYEPAAKPNANQAGGLMQMDGMTMAILGVAALAAVQGYMWVRSGDAWKTVLLGVGTTLGLGVGGWIWHRWKRSRDHTYDPLLIREKVSQMAFDAEVEVVAVLPRGGTLERARSLLDNVHAAYRRFDHPAGARVKATKIRTLMPDPEQLHPSGPGFFGSRSVMGAREAAALWHPPGAKDETSLVARTGARVLLPVSGGVQSGAPVGTTTAGSPRKICFPDDLMRRHHLYVARTRMGKSTLMHHLVAHKMREKAAGRDGDAIIVVDPHADLVEGLLEQVPDSLANRVTLIDLADDRGAPGINLLDTRVFSDRDRTADSVVRVAKGLWDQWGPRMQSILEFTMKTMYEANESMEADEQFTMLDGLKLLTIKAVREEALSRLSDPYILEWWANAFTSWTRDYRADSLAPVQTRLSYYASSRRARAILGQPRSTIDLRQIIQGGGILLVSTAQGVVGRDVAALVGASLLNLADSVIREQGSKPLDKRRGALVVVDEMQSMPGVDYESMLSELGKFGASFVLATQSLEKLDDLSPTMSDTLMANMGCLAVFQVAGSDARQLVWELGKDRIAEEDVVSLPVHHCYVRATVGKERMPTFSMMVKKPEDGDPDMAARIRDISSSYVTSHAEIALQQAEARKRVEEYTKAMAERNRKKEALNASKWEEAGPTGDPATKPSRSKHFQPPIGDQDDRNGRRPGRDLQ